MKRVGNKSGQLVRSASRRRKTSSRFQFDITIDKVFGVKPGVNYLVKWTRGVKVAQTKPITATKDSATKAGLAINEKLSLLVTLYREDNRKFDPKDSKISLVAVTPKKQQQRTAAKIHFDLSQFAGVPHASSTKLFKLSDTVSIRATVESRFLKAGAAGPGSAGASSALSGVSARSSDDDDDDFDDLALDDVPEVDPVPKSKPSTSVPQQSSHAPPSRVPLISESPRSASSIASERTKPTTRTASSSSTVTSVDSPPPRSTRPRPSPVSSEDVKAFAGAENSVQLDSLRKENGRLSADLAKSAQERASLEESYKRQLQDMNSKLKERTKERESVEGDRTRTAAAITELRENNQKLQTKANVLQEELKGVKQNRDELSAQCKKLGAAEEKCKELSQEVDRLVVAAARPRGDSSDQSDSSEIEKRMDTLRQERHRFERKVKSHEAHAAKTRAAYQKLTEMYNSIRGQHVAVLKEMDELKVKKASEPKSEQTITTSEQGDLLSQLEEAKQEIQDIRSSKDSLQSDYDRLLHQTDSVQDRLERVSQELEKARRENDELHTETEELKGQRDMAMQRALSKGKSNASNSDSTRSIGKVEEELRLTKDKLEREHVRLTRRNVELESEISDLKEDVEYEKKEKTKAREERDKLREAGRALERRTSNAAKQSDAMQSMRRQISTHQMKEKDHESTIARLRSELGTLRKELEKSRNGASLVKSDSQENIGEILQDLVSTKLALAQSEDEKLNLQFAMKIFKKSEKAKQEKLAGHASRLEVKLGQANEELERLRKNRGLEDAAEFNDLGSDVDY